MESSGPSGNTPHHPSHRWARLMGATIAVLTLTLPFLVVTHYSSNSKVDSSPKTSYSLPQANK